ncbi:hypothetical protein [Desulfolithobacter dissulfuricans]|uniref:hypothetical protein n=1 Tax=Desulfolithobacter dissulfuricans TaxID=2795293 RepID=UPI00338E4EFD
MGGPVLSGLIIHWLHWRLIFLITVPVGVLVYLFSRDSTPWTCLRRKTFASRPARPLI